MSREHCSPPERTSKLIASVELLVTGQLWICVCSSDLHLLREPWLFLDPNTRLVHLHLPLIAASFGQTLPEQVPLSAQIHQLPVVLLSIPVAQHFPIRRLANSTLLKLWPAGTTDQVLSFTSEDGRRALVEADWALKLALLLTLRDLIVELAEFGGVVSRILWQNLDLLLQLLHSLFSLPDLFILLCKLPLFITDVHDKEGFCVLLFLKNTLQLQLLPSDLSLLLFYHGKLIISGLPVLHSLFQGYFLCLHLFLDFLGFGVQLCHLF